METHHSTLLESPSFKVSPARGAVILILSAEKILSMLSTTVMKGEAPFARD